ncbi:glycosyltransferase family 2 protein [Halomarina halobia]|uniref:Glycosyltransferase family 2 protein n=1 Tax=Halomarina halobia TaxID=3033386 RepID=A0ABD6A8Q6_9EURY|nr:glycosyltransferase family 2 protein [Halomarina sp. PSR21]
MPIVSVIIPVYNDADVLGRAIESVLAQTLEDFEMIVVDDASSDEPESVLSKYTDYRIRYLVHEQNLGGSAARNTGIKAASGDYIAFLDADDEWFPNKLAKQIQVLADQSNEFVGICCDFEHNRGYLIAEAVDQFLTKSDRGGEERHLGERILARQIALGGASSILLTRDAAMSIDGFDESFQRHQDWEFMIRLSKFGRICYLNEELFRKHETDPPDPETVERSKKVFFEKFKTDIDKAEENGYPVRARHRLELAKCFISDGQFYEGTKRLNVKDINSIQAFFELGYSTLRGLRRYRRGNTV